MTDALQPQLKPELAAIIKDGTPKPQTTLPVFVAPVVAAKPAEPQAVKPVEAAPQPQARGVSPKPKANESPSLVSVNYRLPEHLPTALLKASVDRKVRKVSPATQQEIVAEALTQWLQANGYLK